MYIMSTFVLIHYELELGLFTYFTVIMSHSMIFPNKIQIFFILFTLLVGINVQWFPSIATKQSKVYELFPLLFIATHQLPSISLPTFSPAFGIHWI